MLNTLNSPVTMTGQQLFLLMFIPVIIVVLIIVIILLVGGITRARRDGS